MSDASASNPIDETIARFLAERAGSRGVETYAWIVSVLRSAPDASSETHRHGTAACVVTSCAGQFVIHSLVGDDDADRASIIDHVKERHEHGSIRGLALPGDRRTKNLFEEARLPAQVLLH